MWIIQTPLRTAFHDLNEKLNSSCGLGGADKILD